MITRIEIDGFKSLRDFAVDLEPLTVFIGPNNAGKSNVLEALALLSRLASQPIDEAFKGGRGRALAQFTRSGGAPGKTIRVAVELLLPQSFDAGGAAIPNRCRYELVIERRARSTGAEYLAIAHEGLWALDRASDAWIDAHAELARYVHHAAERHCVFEQVDQDDQARRIRADFGEWGMDERRVSHEHTWLAALGDPYNPFFVTLRNAMNAMVTAGSRKIALEKDDPAKDALAIKSDELVSDVAKMLKRLGELGKKLRELQSLDTRVYFSGHGAPSPGEQQLDGKADRLAGLAAGARELRERAAASALEQQAAGEVLAKLNTPDIRQMAADALSAFRLLHLAPAALRASSERIGVDTLAPDGSNLPTVLSSLPAPLLGEIRADIVSVVPGLSSFEVVPDGDELRIEFVLSGGERLPAELSSDGTLRILALLTALRVQPRPAAIGVDELENGIYPGRLRQLLALLQETLALTGESDAGSAGQLPIQLLMTTHSPVMLDAFRSRLSCLRFVDLVRRDRQLMTRARPVVAEAGPDRGRLAVTLREIDELLQSADSEMASSV
jgi:predicted ATPase